MKTNLPTVRSIEAFLQIARGGNITDVAKELNLSPSAVSRRLHNLESAVGVELLDRRGQRIQLTPEGTKYAENISPVLAAMVEAGHSVKATDEAQQELRIQSSPSFYANLIAPRLAEFLEQWPCAIVTLLTNDSYQANADISIRPSEKDDRLEGEEKLLDITVSPLCRNDVLAKHNVQCPQDMLRVPLIEHVNARHAWRLWFAKAGLKDPASAQRVLVDSSFTMYEAVTGGIGATLFPLVYAPQNSSRNLTHPFSEITINLGSAFIAQRSERPIAKYFYKWLFTVVSDDDPVCV